MAAYRSVMLVDDNEIDNIINEKIIEANAFAEQILVFQTGQDALEYLREHQGDVESLPEIVFLDINMPIMDGITLTRELGGLDSYKYIPILMLTTESAGDKKIEGKAAGATGWIVKPFNPDQLLNTINKVVG